MPRLSGKALDDYITQTIQVTGGTMPITLAAIDEEEAECFRQALKGRRKASTIEVQVFPPHFFRGLASVATRCQKLSSGVPLVPAKLKLWLIRADVFALFA